MKFEVFQKRQKYEVKELKDPPKICPKCKVYLIPDVGKVDQLGVWNICPMCDYEINTSIRKYIKKENH